jgi:hypothetical protein
MHTNEPREAPNAEMGFEVRDVNMPIIGKVIVWFFIFDFLCYAVVAAWFYTAKPHTESNLNPRKPMPTIQLESNISVRADVQELRQDETKTLSEKKLNDDGSYTIPIDQAINIISARGLPHVLSSTPAISPGNTIKQNALQPGSPALNPPTKRPDLGTIAPPSSVPSQANPGLVAPSGGQ